MSIAILYICTGKYSIFWDQFYQSCEQYFLAGHNKHYFVYTETLLPENVKENVSIIHQEKLGWPGDTLMRFHMFSKLRDSLRAFDYIFFLNANAHFNKTIGDTILENPDGEVDLVVVKHPFFHCVTNPKDFPYERRKKSLAYVAQNHGEKYVMGGFNGGRSGAYLDLVETLKSQIDLDLEKNIVALWHDESHLNKYITKYTGKVKVLDYNYGFPEGHDLPLKDDVYLTFLDKSKFGGHDFLREKKDSIPVIRKKLSIKERLHKIKNYLKA